MGVLDVNGKSKLIAFGGFGGYMASCLDSIEEWVDDRQTWSMSTMKLSEAKCNFGYCQLPQC